MSYLLYITPSQVKRISLIIHFYNIFLFHSRLEASRLATTPRNIILPTWTCWISTTAATTTSTMATSTYSAAAAGIVCMSINLCFNMLQHAANVCYFLKLCMSISINTDNNTLFSSSSFIYKKIINFHSFYENFFSSYIKNSLHKFSLTFMSKNKAFFIWNSNSS